MQNLVETQLDFFDLLPLNISVDDQAPAWELDEVDQFVEHFFKASINPLLDNRCSASLRKELMDWLNAPLVLDTGKTIIPFSFEACCQFMDLRPEETREMILDQVRLAQRKAAAATRTH